MKSQNKSSLAYTLIQVLTASAVIRDIQLQTDDPDTCLKDLEFAPTASLIDYVIKHQPDLDAYLNGEVQEPTTGAAVLYGLLGDTYKALITDQGFKVVPLAQLQAYAALTRMGSDFITPDDLEDCLTCEVTGCPMHPESIARDLIEQRKSENARLN